MNKSIINKENLKGITALLVHVANIDETYTDKEKKIIKDFITSFSYGDSSVEDILKEAEKLESDSIQLLSFTNLVKKESLEFKTEVIEHLWKIIISDQSVDQYESSLMRKICGLIYFPDKLAGDIKLKLLK
ncbi:TerB family tellurite resistance protein [Pelagibacteraceae bacterium]|nr:TerB family tellurite resistance protein [Pelagibacteraceae bacterium]|tara:strand:- start:987 stop:1379 length:393 start_codon:yes stop_codon:yes gene_type:complete